MIQPCVWCNVGLNLNGFQPYKDDVSNKQSSMQEDRFYCTMVGLAAITRESFVYDESLPNLMIMVKISIVSKTIKIIVHMKWSCDNIIWTKFYNFPASYMAFAIDIIDECGLINNHVVEFLVWCSQILGTLNEGWLHLASLLNASLRKQLY